MPSLNCAQSPEAAQSDKSLLLKDYELFVLVGVSILALLAMI
jgi:hypothetical protein